MIASIFALSVRNERSVRRLQEAGLFAYDYAHKSKGDLAVLSSCVERLSQGLPKGMLAGSEKSLSLMEDVVSNLKRSAEDILIIAKESKVRLDPISLATVSRLIDERWGWHLRQRQITVENHIVDNNGLLVVDRAMLISIFDNLIQNSIEAIAAKQEETAQYKGTLGVFCSLSDDTVEIYICDDALGISPDIRDKLFKDRVTTKRTGTGLGLTIVRRYIEANRGKVSLCTKLPESAAVSGADDRWRVILKLSFPRGLSDRLYSVLVVDDQKTFYQNLTIDFQSRPAFGNIDYAESLAKALASLKSKKYDALILDMWFGAPPGGAEAYSMLRKSGFSGLVMVVSSFQEKIDEARRLQGVADVLSKDLQRSIPERLENLLRER
jgi:CheY-like chemotaxis protein